MATAQADLINTVTNVLGLSISQRQVLYNEEYGTISTIIHWNYDMIREWCTAKYKLTTTRGGATCGDSNIRCIQTFTWWDTNLTLRGKHIDLAEFNFTMTGYCIYEENLD